MSKKNNYDLELRTLNFSKSMIRFCKKVPKNVITLPIINRLIRSVTSIGANYREANGASSKKDFRNKIFICKKEAKETEYWICVCLESICELHELCKEGSELKKEAYELILIFSSIAKNSG